MKEMNDIDDEGREYVIKGDLRYVKCPLCGKVMHRTSHSLNYYCDNCGISWEVRVKEFVLRRGK